MSVRQRELFFTSYTTNFTKSIRGRSRRRATPLERTSPKLSHVSQCPQELRRDAAEMQANLVRLNRAGCQPQKLVALQGAPLPIAL